MEKIDSEDCECEVGVGGWPRVGRGYFSTCLLLEGRVGIGVGWVWKVELNFLWTASAKWQVFWPVCIGWNSTVSSELAWTRDCLIKTKHCHDCHSVLMQCDFAQSTECQREEIQVQVNNRSNYDSLKVKGKKCWAEHQKLIKDHWPFHIGSTDIGRQNNKKCTETVQNKTFYSYAV